MSATDTATPDSLPTEPTEPTDAEEPVEPHEEPEYDVPMPGGRGGLV